MKNKVILRMSLHIIAHILSVGMMLWQLLMYLKVLFHLVACCKFPQLINLLSILLMCLS